MSDQPTLEYSNHQKEIIARQLLEFYKDGKYAFDPDANRQSQSHYNRKSEIIKSIDKWCKMDDVARWIIPIIDYNLETSYEELEKEWDKSHRLAIKVEDLENKYHYMEVHFEDESKKRAKEMMDKWVSEKEDVAKLHEEIEELKNRRTEMIRRNTRGMNGLLNQNNQLQASIKRIEDERREVHFKSIESELNDKKESPSLKKEVKKLQNQNMKLEKDSLKHQEKVMKNEMKYLELKSKTEASISQLKTDKEKLKTDNEKLQLELEYYKLKHSVEAQYPLHPHPQVEDVLDQDPVD